MPSAVLAPFIPEHLALMRIKDNAKEVAGNPEIGVKLMHLGAKTLFYRGTPLAVMGYVPLISGVCEVFVLATEDQRDHPLVFARTVKKELMALKIEYRRIQAIAANDKFHARWLSWIGFKREGWLKKYGLHGEDMVMWGMT